MEDVIYLDGPHHRAHSFKNKNKDYGIQPLERVLYRPSEVAHLLGISRSQLYLLMAAGSLNGVKIGRSTRFTKKNIEDFVNNLRELIPSEVDENENEETI